MNIFHATILAIIEGLTEFLPISSTGHMILATKLMGIAETGFVTTFQIIIQLGAILAVAVLYAKTLLINKTVFIRVAAAFAPTAIVGFLLYKLIKTVLFTHPIVTVIALAAGGGALLILEYFYKEQPHHTDDIAKLTIPQAMLIGLTQSLSVVPGVSRAAATIVGGLLVGLKRTAAVEFSFMLAIPTMIAATGLDLVRSPIAFSGEEFTVLAVGCIVSFIVAYAVVKYFLGFVKKHSFILFAWYRIAIALLFFIFVLR